MEELTFIAHAPRQRACTVMTLAIGAASENLGADAPPRSRAYRGCVGAAERNAAADVSAVSTVRTQSDRMLVSSRPAKTNDCVCLRVRVCVCACLSASGDLHRRLLERPDPTLHTAPGARRTGKDAVRWTEMVGRCSYKRHCHSSLTPESGICRTTRFGNSYSELAVVCPECGVFRHRLPFP